MSLTVHYISREWDLKSHHMFETGEITLVHTTVNLLNYLKKALVAGIWLHRSVQLSLTMLQICIKAAINTSE